MKSWTVNEEWRRTLNNFNIYKQKTLVNICYGDRPYFSCWRGIGNLLYSSSLGFPWNFKSTGAIITGNSAANDEGRALTARWPAEKCHGGIPYHVSHLLISGRSPKNEKLIRGNITFCGNWVSIPASSKTVDFVSHELHSNKVKPKYIKIWVWIQELFVFQFAVNNQINTKKCITAISHRWKFI